MAVTLVAVVQTLKLLYNLYQLMSDKSENEFQFLLNTLLQAIQGTGR